MNQTAYILHYEGFAIHNINGLYKIPELPTLWFISMNDAKKEIEKRKFFNIKPPNDKTNKAEIIES